MPSPLTGDSCIKNSPSSPFRQCSNYSHTYNSQCLARTCYCSRARYSAPSTVNAVDLGKLFGDYLVRHTPVRFKYKQRRYNTFLTPGRLHHKLKPIPLNASPLRYELSRYVHSTLPPYPPPFPLPRPRVSESPLYNIKNAPPPSRGWTVQKRTPLDCVEIAPPVGEMKHRFRF